MSKGIARERQVRKLLESEGWWVGRAAGSLGDADLFASRPYVEHGYRNLADVRLIEVKATSRGPWHGFGPQDRRDLLVAARKAGAVAWLYWWPSRGQLKCFHEDYWPLTPGEDYGADTD
jgi:Holliday junction resolvase